MRLRCKWKLLCFMLATGCFFSPISYAQVCCLVNALNVSTGLNPVTGTLTPGNPNLAPPALDTRWRVRSVSPALIADVGDDGPPAPVLTTTGPARIIQPFPGWPMGGANWINCFNSNTYTSGGLGVQEMTIERPFTLCTAATITVAGMICADNFIPNMSIVSAGGSTTIFSQADPGAGAITGCQPMTATITLPAGTHTITVTVRQDPTGAGCGFSFNGTITAGTAAIVREDNPGQCGNYAGSCGPTITPGIICMGTGTTPLGAIPTGGTWTSLSSAFATVDMVTGIPTGVTPGTATIMYTDLCGNSATAVFTVVAAPDASISGTYHVCSGNVVSIPVTGTNVTSASYTSVAGSGSVSVPGTITLTAPTTTTGTTFPVSLTGSSHLCPLASTSATVVVHKRPKLYAFHEITGNHCEGTTLTYYIKTDPGMQISYSYTGAPAYYSVTADAAGEHYVSIPAVACSTIFHLDGLYNPAADDCWTMLNKRDTVCVAPYPTIGTIFGGPNPICVGQTATLTVGATGTACSYPEWTFTPDPGTLPTAVSFSSSGSSPVTVTGVSGGSGTISYVVANCCTTAVQTTTFTVNALPSVTDIEYVGCKVPCPGTTLVFKITGTPNATVNWTWEDPCCPMVTNPGGSVMLNSGGVGYATITGGASVPGIATISTFNIVGANGCVNPWGKVGMVEVAWPTAAIQQQPSPICAGGCFTLTFTGPPLGTAYYNTIPAGPLDIPVALDAYGMGTHVICGLMATTTYRVTGAANSCCFHASMGTPITVTVVPYPVVSLTSNSPVCEGDSIVLTGTCSPASATYDWTGPNPIHFPTSTTVPNYTIHVATLADDGVYTITGYNTVPGLPAPCATTDTTIVIVKPLPSITSLSYIGCMVPCPGTVLPFKIVGTPGATVTWTWEDPASPGSPLPGGSVTLNWAGVGTASITPGASMPGMVTISLTGITGTNGCFNPIGKAGMVMVDWPKADFCNSIRPDCEGNPFRLELCGTPGATVQIAATPGGPFGITVILDASGHGYSPILNPSTTTTYQITSVTGTCCTHTFSGPTITVVRHPYPVVSLTAAPPAVCVGGSFVLNATCVGCNTPNFWQGPTAPLPAYTPPSVLSYAISPATMAHNGLYTFTGTFTDPVNQVVCASKATTNVVVDTTPYAYMSCSGNLCQYSPSVILLTFTGTPGSYVTYTSFPAGYGGGVYLSGTSTTVIVNVPYPTSNIDFYLVSVTSPSGTCTINDTLAGCSMYLNTRPPCPISYDASTGIITIAGWGPGMSLNFSLSPGGTFTYSGLPSTFHVSAMGGSAAWAHLMSFNDGICNWTYAYDVCAVYIPSLRPAATQKDDIVTSISISPNPNTGSFTLAGTLATSSNQEVIAIEIVDALGKVILTEDISVENGNIHKTINMDKQIANGIYLVRLRNEHVNHTLRFTLAR